MCCIAPSLLSRKRSMKRSPRRKRSKRRRRFTNRKPTRYSLICWILIHSCRSLPTAIGPLGQLFWILRAQLTLPVILPEFYGSKRCFTTQKKSWHKRMRRIQRSTASLTVCWIPCDRWFWKKATGCFYRISLDKFSKWTCQNSQMRLPSAYVMHSLPRTLSSTIRTQLWMRQRTLISLCPMRWNRWNGLKSGEWMKASSKQGPCTKRTIHRTVGPTSTPSMRKRRTYGAIHMQKIRSLSILLTTCYLRFLPWSPTRTNPPSRTF